MDFDVIIANGLILSEEGETRADVGIRGETIASVGPVVSDELKSQGLRTDIYPANDAFFMKPLISAMAAALGKTAPRTAHG